MIKIILYLNLAFITIVVLTRCTTYEINGQEVSKAQYEQHVMELDKEWEARDKAFQEKMNE